MHLTIVTGIEFCSAEYKGLLFSRNEFFSQVHAAHNNYVISE